MATVKSLGLHKPAGLQHAIRQEILPENPPSSSYTWHVFTDKVIDDGLADELLITSHCVVWHRGGRFRRTFNFDIEKEPIKQALLTYFPESEDEGFKKKTFDDSETDDRPRLSRALIVFLQTQAHIYFLRGTDYVVHLPFEVESVFVGPVGIIIQRKQRTENVAPISLKFPRVPPNSFVSSQMTAFNSSQQSTFSVEGLGNPKALPLKFCATLENMWDAPIEHAESHWPRLISFTDPLQEFGLVVTDPNPQATKGLRKNASKKPSFLHPAEELLHVEEIKLPRSFPEDVHEPLIVGVTVNRETSSYSVWRLTYLSREDPFLNRGKDASSKASRRRSSMQPSFASGASTPIQPNFRESFGAPLPGKRQRKSERIEKPMDLVSSLEQQDKEGSGVTRRSSRRVSSMLARADLSASHERPVYAEQPLMSSHGGSKKGDSQSAYQRLSSSYGHQIHPSLSSLLEAPFDVGLDEGFHNMGLDDHDFDGLQHEIVFTKIHTVPLENANFRYSTSEQPARNQTKVFILTAPPFAVNEYNRSQLLIGIQDRTEKRLQLITLHLQVNRKSDRAAKIGDKEAPREATVSITLGDLRRAQNVLDSCKLVDEDQSVILVLSESMDGRHELSTQAPWSERTIVSPSVVVAEDLFESHSFRQPIDRMSKQTEPETIDLSKGSIVGIRHPRPGGLVDVVDAEGRLHQLVIQIQPTSAQVCAILRVCRGILPNALGERIAAGWLHCMQWMASSEEVVEDPEWSAAVTLLFALFLNLGRADSGKLPTTRLPVRRRKRPASRSFGSTRGLEDEGALDDYTTMEFLAQQPWMMEPAWEWVLNEIMDEIGSSQGDQNAPPSFIAQHITFAREYAASHLGQAAFGVTGYMPTSLGKSSETRRKIAIDVFMGLHLLLEERRLNTFNPEYDFPGRDPLRVVLCQIARWLKWNDFSSVYELGIQEEIDQRHDSELVLKPPIPPPPVRPDVFDWFRSHLITDSRDHYLTPADVYYTSSRLSETDKSYDRRWDLILPQTFMLKRFFKSLRPNATAVQMVEAMGDAGMTKGFLETIPEGMLVPLRDAISLCQPRPPSSWSKDLLELIDRGDINRILVPGKRTGQFTSDQTATRDYSLISQVLREPSKEKTSSRGGEEEEGSERQAVARALFKEDRRLNTAQDLLSTHKPRVVRLDPDPSWPESQYLEKQKELVARIAIGTLAIPAGRGLLYYGLRFPLITQKFQIGGFNFHCVVKPTNTTVGVEKSLFTEEKVCWGFFHQGAAAGLAISPQAKGIDTSWILFNKPEQELSNRHAGFLLALGLNGHLKDVAKWVAFKYLTPKHTMTSIGLLLGLAASYMGTMDSLITRLLSVHATRMLPRGSAELNLSPLTQTSGIMGIGLLYANSQHRRMSEIMLSEIEHIDEEDEEEPLRSECYRLAAGFALGFINLGKGNDLKGLYDMKLAEKLIYHATATKNVEIVHVLDRAAAGAAIAIALIYMKTEDQSIARKIDVPDSILQFDYVRPDILLLRTVAKNLILWSTIEPTLSWVQRSLPGPYRTRYKLQGTTRLRSTDLPFFSILAGICFSIALRFSGSASLKVRDLLLHYLDQFIRITKITPTPKAHPDAPPPYDEELARTNARMCQDILALSASIVMAGTGDIPVLRRLRSLHGRDNPDTPYGSHLAAHLAIGALFLGCGTVTFGSSNQAIAALLLSFYPVFPTNVMDNRSHLQAFRHFWVLATEQRCLITKDTDTEETVSIPVQIKMLKNASTEPVLTRTTPCLLPPLEQISKVSTVCGSDFWDVEIDFSNEKLRAAFKENQVLELRRRPPREGAFTSTLKVLGQQKQSKVPLSWISQFDSFHDFNPVDRTADPLQCDGLELTTTSREACLAMENGILNSRDRDRLESVKLVLEWAAVRDRLLGVNVHDSQATLTQAGGDEDDVSRPEEDMTGQWWMRDTMIERLKAKVWEASRERDQE